MSEAVEEQLPSPPAAVSQSRSSGLPIDSEAVGSSEIKTAPAQENGFAGMQFVQLSGNGAASACDNDAVHPAHEDGAMVQQPWPPSIVQDGASQVDVHCNPLYDADVPAELAHPQSSEDLATAPMSTLLPSQKDQTTFQKRRSARRRSSSSAVADGAEQVSLQS